MGTMHFLELPKDAVPFNIGGMWSTKNTPENRMRFNLSRFTTKVSDNVEP
jgi:hypothetical protein